MGSGHRRRLVSGGVTAVASPPAVDPRLRRRSMTALFAGVSCATVGMVATSTVATLVAADVGGNGWSGTPNAASTLGTAAGALWLARVIARRGARSGLLAGYLLGVLGAATAFAGAAEGMLALVLLGMVLIGIGNGGAQLARYAAAELYPADRRGTGLSVIVWAGTIGAILGPTMIAPAADLASALDLEELAGPVGISALVIGVGVLATLALPRIRPAGVAAPRMGRAELATAFRLPAVRFALPAMATAHIAMVAVMTMTPVQLHDHGHGLGVVGAIFSAHMIGMFALAPVSGRIADRAGGRVAMIVGAAGLVASAAVAVAAPTDHLVGLPVALFLLGFGWNLVFVGGSSVLSRELPAEQRTEVQGVVDALVWGASALGSLSAAQLFGVGGYALVAVAAGALVVAVSGRLAWAARRDRLARV